MITEQQILSYMDKVIEDVKRIVSFKGREYTPNDEDALTNIREIAKMTNRTPRDICYILATKHWQSLLRNSSVYNIDTMVEKRTDIITYIVYAEMFRLEEIEKEMERDDRDWETFLRRQYM